MPKKKDFILSEKKQENSYAMKFQSDKNVYLDNFIQVIFSLKHFTSFCSDINKIWIEFLIERFKGLQYKRWQEKQNETQLNNKWVVTERLNLVGPT